MNPVKLKIFTSTFLLIFFYFPENLNGFINNCDGRNCAERNDAIREFERSPMERENRKMNVRDRVGSERLVNNRRIVDSDSRISENLASRSFDFPRLVERTRQSRVCDARLAGDRQGRVIENRQNRLVEDRRSRVAEDQRSRSSEDRQNRVVRDRSVRVENRQTRLAEDRQNRMTEDRQRQNRLVRDRTIRTVEDRRTADRRNRQVEDRRSRSVEDRRVRQSDRTSRVEDPRSLLVEDKRTRLVEVRQNRLVIDRESRSSEARRSRQAERSQTLSRDNRVPAHSVEDRRVTREDRLTESIRERRIRDTSRASDSDSSRRDVRQAQRTNIRIMGRETSERRNVDVNNNRQIAERYETNDRDRRFSNRDSSLYTKNNDISQWANLLTTTFGVLLLAQIISSSNTKKFGVPQISNFLHGIKEKIY